MRKRIFGFDLGIASIGWAVVDFDKEYFDHETGEVIEGQIIKSGVRCFPVAENPKDGSSLAAPRREKRLARRICRRKARRMQEIKQLFIDSGLVADSDMLQKLYAEQKDGDVWNLRIKALTQKLTAAELVRVLTHLAKHRGFKSYRKAAEESDAEGGKVLKAIKANSTQLYDNKTLAQIIVERAGKNGKKRNYTETNAKGKEEAVYINSIPRIEIMRETKLIYEVQKREKGLFTDELYAKFCKIAFRYREAGSVANMVGQCIFEKDEKRAPREAPTSELFVALTKINNMSLNDNGKIRTVSPTERKQILEILKNTKLVKYSTLSSKVFAKGVKFRDIDYNKTEKRNKNNEVKTVNPEDITFYEMKGWHKLKAQFDKDEWAVVSKDTHLLDKVVNIIACEKNDAAITKALKELGVKDEWIEKFNNCTFDKFINLSFKALYNIVPYMMDSLHYNEACEKVGYDHKLTVDKLVEHKGIYLEAIASNKLTKVPVVNRTVAQFRKVYNAMARQYGLPDQINIEMGRDLKKTFDERRNLKNRQDENMKQREIIEKELNEHKIKVNAKNILKYRLYKEQSCKCIYSGKTIDLERLDEVGYLDVDHIIPYSRSFDDSYNNKVLCLSEENRKKGNKTPFDYIKNEMDWAEFEARVKLLHNKKKEDLLLCNDFQDRELAFKERNANDNSYISRYVKQYCEDGIDFSFSPWKDIKNRIQMRAGYLTDYLRWQWGLSKDRNANDRHHAQDAIVIACATQGMVSYLSYVSSVFENKFAVQAKTGEAWYQSLKKKWNEPWTGFRDSVLKSIEEIFVSRPPRKNATGEIHQERIRTINPNNKKYSEKDVKSGIFIRGGLANNGNMLRTDVFVKKNKKGKEQFYLVPVYLSDMGKELPNKAIVVGKDEKDWLIIDDSYTFKFSMFMDDLIKITKGNKAILGYFCGTHRVNASITLEEHDRVKITEGIGVKGLDKFQKFSVDPLGNITEIKQETRLPLTNIKSNKQRMAERKARREKLEQEKQQQTETL